MSNGPKILIPEMKLTIVCMKCGEVCNMSIPIGGMLLFPPCPTCIAVNYVRGRKDGKADCERQHADGRDNIQ